MNFTFEMAVNALEATLILNFLVMYFGYRTTGRLKILGTMLIWCISFISISFFSWTHLYESYASSLQILMNIIFCCWLLRGTFMQKVFVSAFTMGIIAVLATLIMLLFGGLTDKPAIYFLSQFSTIRVTAVLTTKLLFFVISRIILRIRGDGRIKWIDFILLLIIPAFSILAITLMAYAVIQAPAIQDQVFYAVCVVLFLNILIYFVFVRLSQSNKIEMEIALLNMQNECLQANSKEIESMYDDVRALKHDMKNHLTCITEMAKNNDTEGIQQYAERLLKIQHKHDKLIMFSGNKILDAIITNKYHIAVQAGVQFQTIITASLSDIPPEDIIVLIGNSLDNAIRAAKSSENKTISLHIQPQGAYTAITVSNSIADSVLNQNPLLWTTKSCQNQHGFGIKNMKRVVERNRGMIRIFEKNKQFICDILLLNVQSRNEL